MAHRPCRKLIESDIVVLPGSLVVSAALFYIGAHRINIEFIVGGGIGITIAIGVIAGRIFDSSSAQGAVITATGVAISALSLFIVRRNDSRST